MNLTAFFPETGVLFINSTKNGGTENDSIRNYRSNTFSRNRRSSSERGRSRNCVKYHDIQNDPHRSARVVDYFIREGH